MREISLCSISLCRFRSFIEETVIDLSGIADLRLITGVNNVEPRLGANGIGKSTIFDALCFCLYGTSVRGLRASDLISHGHNDCIVTAVLKIAGEVFSIKRIAPPSKVFVNNELVEQAAVEKLVGLSKIRFMSSVLFGQAVPLFLDLAVPQRGELLDEVLGLELWMRAAQQASTQHAAKSSELNTVRTALARINGQIDELPDVVGLKQKERAWSQGIKDTILGLKRRHAELVTSKGVSAAELEALPELVEEGAAKAQADAAQMVVTTLSEQRGALNHEKRALEDEIAFLQENESCPTCGQPMTDSEKHLAADKKKLSKLKDQIDELSDDIRSAQDFVIGKVEALRSIIRSNENIKQQRSLHRSLLKERDGEIGHLLEIISSTEKAANPFTQQRIAAVHRRRELKSLAQEKEETETAILMTLTSLDYWRGGFKKVRLFCLERVLQELTLEAQNSMYALGLLGWNIKFATTSETKSGTVRLGVQVEITANAVDRKFETMSGGESQRARLAVSLGLSSLIQRWGGVRWTVEVFDEPTAWLSEQGVEDLLEVLSSRARSQHKQIWLCDHRALSAGSFSEVVSVYKDDNGSHVSRRGNDGSF